MIHGFKFVLVETLCSCLLKSLPWKSLFYEAFFGICLVSNMKHLKKTSPTIALASTCGFYRFPLAKIIKRLTSFSCIFHSYRHVINYYSL